MKARNGSQTAWVIGVAVLLMGAASTSVKGSQWYVATNGAAPCDGSSWVTAFTNVQAALDAAQSNDTIYLKGETFALPLNSGNGKLVWTNSWVTMVGGYAGEVGGMPGATTNTATVLLNNLSQNLASNRVMYVSNVTNGTIRNVTIRGGRVLNQHGGGLYVTGCTNLMLDAVTVEANAVRYYHSGSSFGGGLYALNSWGVITNSVFQNNGMSGTWSELRGGAMYLGGGGWRVRDCVIRNNTSSGDDSGHTCNIRGVGIYINAGTHEVKNCLLTHNCGYVNSAQGEAVYVENGTIAIKNSTVFYQPSEGIRRAGGTLTVTDSIVWNNGDDIAGTGIALQYCDIEDGDTGTACFSLNPQFERGLYLSASSSCVNTGSTTAAAAGLEGYTTRADGTTEGATTVDLGYHFKGGVAFPELYVSVNSGGDMNAGTSPGMGNAFKTVGKALAVAGDGSHINIEAGTYGTNTEVFPWTVANKYGVQLLATNAETTLVNLAGANARALTMSYCYPDAVVQNLTVANANWSAPGSNWGTPGTLGFDLYLEHVQGVVAGCTLTNSLIPRYGGGSGQSGYPAGALYGSRSDLVVSNCVVSRHTSISAYAEGYWAAGMVLNNVNGSVLNCVISTNVTRGADTAGWGFGYGSGLYVSGTGIVRNCLISGNSGTGVQNIHGQGVYVGGGTWRLENCTIVSNVLEGLYRAAGTVGVTNCILWGNGDDVFGAATLAYSDIEDGDNIGVGGCISNNPIFTTGYRLALGSPCVNTGTNLAWMQGAKDLDGYNRLRGVAVDRGAYETFIPLAITNLPVTIIDSSNAGLNGQLLSDGDAPPANAWVFWGPLDQGMTKDGWANTNALGACQVAATLTTNVFLTPPSGSYSYRYYVSNAVTEAWSDPAATFAVGVSVWLAATDPNASELGGDPGTFRVCRPPTATNDLLVVNFTVSGTAIEGVDYQALGTSVTIPVGATNAPITITPLGDRLLEGTETVTVTLASGTYIVGTPSTDSVAIGDWTPPAYACVAATGGASDYGTNWASAYTSLQFAVDNSLDGDTIYLAAGLYRLTNALTVNSKGLTIVGGYEFGAAMPGAWSADTPSILSPTGGTMRVVSVSGATNVTLRRLTISGGLQSGPIATTIYGAGITVSGSSNILFDTLVVTNNAIQASQSTVNLGGGLYALNSWGTVTNCLFRNNRLGRTYGTSSFGGGVYLQGGGWTVRDSVVRENLIAYYGDANGAGTGRGAGVYASSGSHLLKNCLVIGNRAPVNVVNGTSQGDALYVAAGTVTVQNVTAGFHLYEGIRCGGGLVTMTDSIFWGNGNNAVGVVASNVVCCDIGPADRVFSAAQTNLSVDPLFERGFYLAAGSPCFDAGSQPVAGAGLGGNITRADGTVDTGTVDLGYHFTAGVAPATADLYVSSGSGSDVNLGTNEATQLRTITKALSMATDGTRIHIAGGSYTNGAETFPLAVQGKLGLQLLGAGSGSTVINATGANARAVSLAYAYPDARIEGLTITGVRYSPAGAPVQGGGIYLNDAGITVAACTISNNNIYGNNWGWAGAASPAWGGAEGCGLFAVWCDGVLSNSIVKGNSMSSWFAACASGGGIWANHRWTFINCVIAQNVAYAVGDASWHPWATGGGMHLEGFPVVRNCLLYGNDAQSTAQTTPKGDGLYFGTGYSGPGSGLIENCTVVTNLGYGLQRDGGTVTGRNLIVWNNGIDATGTMSIAFSDVGVSGGVDLNNSISTDPMFAFAATNDYRPLYTSPCINTGTNLPWMTNGLDLAGAPRLQNKQADMGAYEIIVPASGVVFTMR